MTGILLGAAMLISSAAPPPPQPLHVALVPHVSSFELNENRFGDFRPGRRSFATVAASAKHSKVDRIIAIAAGASVGWFAGGAIGYAVTPKRGPYDDTSGLKGVIIGAPIGAVAGALLGYRFTK